VIADHGDACFAHLAEDAGAHRTVHSKIIDHHPHRDALFHFFREQVSQALTRTVVDDGERGEIEAVPRALNQLPTFCIRLATAGQESY
jgi:hypothetical protein